MAYNKIVYGGRTLIDLTGLTISEDKLLSGFTAVDKSGEEITGTCTFDVDSQDATAAVAEILFGKTAYVRGTKLTGTMPNRGAATGTISTINETYTIQQGYHDGSGTVGISAAEKSKLVGANIREGITILGVTGTMNGLEGAKAQAKIISPLITEQIITPDEGYNYLSQVTISAISFVESENSAGGITVTIA